MKMYEEHEMYGEADRGSLYKIGMFAAMNRVTVKALRFYEEQGLLLPAYIDSETGYRYYKLNQMATLHQISALKQAGFTLEEIVRINSGEDEETILRNKKSELLSKIAELTKQVAVLDGYLAKKKYCFTNYLEPGYKEEAILVELCESVTKCKDDTGELHFRTMPKLQVASIFHKGSYNTLATSYESVLQYVEENGYEIVGAIRESYIDGVWNKEDESEWLTEIQVPIRKIASEET